MKLGQGFLTEGPRPDDLVFKMIVTSLPARIVHLMCDFTIKLTANDSLISLSTRNVKLKQLFSYFCLSRLKKRIKIFINKNSAYIQPVTTDYKYIGIRVGLYITLSRILVRGKHWTEWMSNVRRVMQAYDGVHVVSIKRQEFRWSYCIRSGMHLGSSRQYRFLERIHVIHTCIFGCSRSRICFRSRYTTHPILTSLMSFESLTFLKTMKENFILKKIH